MAGKIYDVVKDILENEPFARNSDKALIWSVWQKLGYVKQGSFISYHEFMQAPSTESIRRTRQKLQESRPDLAPSLMVKKARQEKQKTKGAWVYHEDVAVWVEGE